MNPSNPKVFVKQKNRAFIYIYDFKEGDGVAGSLQVEDIFIFKRVENKHDNKPSHR